MKQMREQNREINMSKARKGRQKRKIREDKNRREEIGQKSYEKKRGKREKEKVEK